MQWVDLHGLLACHVARHGAVLEGLGLHDTLHVGRPAVLAGHKAAWGVGQTVGNNNLLGLVAKHLLDQLHRFSQEAFFSSHSFFSSSDFSMLRPSLVMLRIFLPSYSLSCWMAYSSIGSTM